MTSEDPVVRWSDSDALQLESVMEGPIRNGDFEGLTEAGLETIERLTVSLEQMVQDIRLSRELEA